MYKPESPRLEQQNSCEQMRKHTKEQNGERGFSSALPPEASSVSTAVGAERAPPPVKNHLEPLSTPGSLPALTGMGPLKTSASRRAKLSVDTETEH